MSTKIYGMVTDAIIKKIESGDLNWRKPWSGAVNGASGKEYRGINVLLTAGTKYGARDWYTFKQAKKLGGIVKKGESGTMIVFWKFPTAQETKDAINGGDRPPSPYARYYRVFNREQIQWEDEAGLKDFTVKNELNGNEGDCQNLIREYMEGLNEFLEGGNSAYYNVVNDTVVMPEKNRFDSIEEYYSTLYHELTHSTRHPERLNRAGGTPNRFGSNDYSQEELVAEFGAAFLCAKAGIDNVTQDNSAAYLQSWVSRFKEKPKMLVMAAQQAQKAVDLIIGK